MAAPQEEREAVYLKLEKECWIIEEAEVTEDQASIAHPPKMLSMLANSLKQRYDDAYEESLIEKTKIILCEPEIHVENSKNAIELDEAATLEQNVAGEGPMN